MKSLATELLRAARLTVAVAAYVVTGVAPALAQEEAAQNQDIQTIPVETGEPQAAAPADGKAATGDKNAQELDTIEVTGSRIRRADYESEQPVLVIKREDIERTGLVSIGDILQNLPQAGAAINTAFNNGGDGAIEIDLRNLGSERVLVLVNGRRWVGGLSSLRTGAVDLTTIPVSLIESVEILKDGASAVYGSDAIAGVINIKLRRDFTGAEMRGHYGMTEKGDGAVQDYSFAGGTVAGPTSVFINGSYFKQSELFAGERTIPAQANPAGTGLSRGSSFIPGTRTLFVPTPTNGTFVNLDAGELTGNFAPCQDITADVVNGTAGDDILTALPLAVGASLCDTAELGVNTHRFDVNSDSYNYAPINYLLTPSERTGIFGQLSHEIAHGLRFTSELLYNRRTSSQLLAETPLAVGDALPAPFSFGYVAADNPYNPTNPQSPYYIPGTSPQDIGKADQAAGVVGLGGVLRRMKESGPRIFQQSVDTYRLGGGLDGNFEFLKRFFYWDSGYAHTESNVTITEIGGFDMTRVARAVGPLAECVGTDDPTDQVGDLPPPPSANGCVPLDMFGGTGTVTPAMLKYISATSISKGNSIQRNAYANMSTEIPELDFLLPGPLGVAIGVEYRKEQFSGTPDPLKAAGVTSNLSATATHGEYTAQEAYGEIRVPVLKDFFLARELDLSLAARYSKYSGFGNNLSYKGGARWKPIDQLLVRSTYSTSFRAPSVGNLYLGRAQSFPEVADPCSDYTTSDDPDVVANCEADGVPDTYSQTNGQIATVFGGNPNLEPETAKSLTAGLVWSPPFIPDFNAYIDWYRIELEDFITVPGAAAILELCYSSAERALCEFVHRTDTGEIDNLENVFTNFAALNVEGVDLSFDYIIPGFEFLKPLGTFKILGDASYVTTYDQITPDASGGDVTTGLVGIDFGGQGAIPRWKANIGLTWSRGNFEGSWLVRYIHHVVEPCDDDRQEAGGNGGNPTQVLSFVEYGLCSDPGAPGGPENEIEAVFYNDVQFGYNLVPFNTKLTLGINNLLDQNPPMVVSSFASSYDPTLHEFQNSRTGYLKFQVNF